MNSSRFCRKRELSPLRRACVSLGLEVNAQPKTDLAWRLRKVGLGKTAIDYLRFSEDEQARQIVALYARLNATERKAVSIDYLIMAAGADVHHIWGCIQEQLSRVRGMTAGLLVCEAAPEVMRKTIEYAKMPNGYRDRELVLRTYVAAVLPNVPVRHRG